MPSHKKVILRRFLGDSLFGYLPQSRFVHDDAVALLDLEGRRTDVPLADIRTIFFVRDFNRDDPRNPEQLSRLAFSGRPRGEGLWVRVTLRDGGDPIEGLAPLDRSLADDLALDHGLQLSPPDTRSNTLRLFIPQPSIAELRLLAVITAPGRQARQRPPAPPAPTTQEQLFGRPGDDRPGDDRTGDDPSGDDH